MAFLGLFAPLAKNYVVSKKRIEPFEEEKKMSDIRTEYILNSVWIVDTILLIWALFLSFKRNNGFDLRSFLLACCCSPCYIAYAYAVPAKKKKK